MISSFQELQGGVRMIISPCFIDVFWYLKKNRLTWIWSNPQAIDLVENHDFKKIKKRKESKWKVFKFVAFKTTWASKIIEKQLDQAKKRSSDITRCLGCFCWRLSSATSRNWKSMKKHWFYYFFGAAPAQVSATQRESAKVSECQGRNPSRS